MNHLRSQDWAVARSPQWVLQDFHGLLPTSIFIVEARSVFLVHRPRILTCPGTFSCIPAYSTRSRGPGLVLSFALAGFCCSLTGRRERGEQKKGGTSEVGDDDVHLIQLIELVPHVLTSVQNRFGLVQLRVFPLPPFPVHLIVSSATRSVLRGAGYSLPLRRRRLQLRGQLPGRLLRVPRGRAETGTSPDPWGRLGLLGEARPVSRGQAVSTLRRSSVRLDSSGDRTSFLERRGGCLHVGCSRKARVEACSGRADRPARGSGGGRYNRFCVQCYA